MSPRNESISGKSGLSFLSAGFSVVIFSTGSGRRVTRSGKISAGAAQRLEESLRLQGCCDNELMENLLLTADHTLGLKNLPFTFQRSEKTMADDRFRISP